MAGVGNSFLFPPLLDWTPLLAVCSCSTPVCPADGGSEASEWVSVTCRIRTAWRWNTDTAVGESLMHWCVWDAGNKTKRSNSEWITDEFIFQLFVSLTQQQEETRLYGELSGLTSGQLTAPPSSSSRSCHWGSSGVWFGSPDGPPTPPSAWNTQEGRLHYIMPAHHMTPCSQTPPPSCCYTHCTCSAVVLQTYKGHAGLWPFINHLLQLPVFVLVVQALKLPCQGERHHIH